MRRLEGHPNFTKWRDPVSGAESYVLSRRLAPFQQGLYYVRPSLAGDWLWFSVSFPPSRTKFLAAACLDPERPEARWFPQAPLGGNPLIAPDGACAFAPIGNGAYRIDTRGESRELFHLPESIVCGRHLFRLVTDLTLSCDGRYFLLDCQIGNRWLIGLVDRESGETKPLRWFGHSHHHASFSLHDPELFLVCQGPNLDPLTGEKNEMDVRLWIMDTRLTRYEPLYGDLWFNHSSMGCHEWWTSQGLVNWCDYRDGIYESTTAPDRRRSLVWRRPLIHGQCDPTARFYCGDENCYRWNEAAPCSVWFFDRKTGCETAIAKNLPQPPFHYSQWRSYHTDPHPHFSADGEYVIYGTTVLGNMDVALAPVKGLLEAQGASGT